MNYFKEKLKERLLPIYSRLLKNNTDEDICVFCMQWGNNFPQERNTGVLFVGKAVNGWISKETSIDVLFDSCSPNEIFCRGDQMQWVQDKEGNGGYNTRKSAFWRVIKKVSLNFYPEENWSSHVAWSNLCKVAPFKGGNPSDKQYYKQLEYCKEILAQEVEILSPKYVILYTSGWEKDFLCFLNGNKVAESIKEASWNGHETKLYIINSINYIVSQHPQGKPESEHVDAIVSLMKEAK